MHKARDAARLTDWNTTHHNSKQTHGVKRARTPDSSSLKICTWNPFGTAPQASSPAASYAVV